MALSGSFNFVQGRDELLKDALVTAHVVDIEDTLSNAHNQLASRELNRMVKAWQAYGLQLYCIRPSTLFMQDSKSSYVFGTDHITESYTETAVKTAAAASATSIDVDSTTGMTAGDYIGVELTDGTSHWTTVSSVTDSDTVVIATGLASAAAVDKVVYFYTTKASLPLRLDGAYRRAHSGTQDTPLLIDSRMEHWEISQKTVESTPNTVFFDPRRDAPRIILNCYPNSVIDTIRLNCQFPLDDLDGANDNLAFPQYMYDTVHYNLAYRFAVLYGADKNHTFALKMQAKEAIDLALSFDVETTSTYFHPRLS